MDITCELYQAATVASTTVSSSFTVRNGWLTGELRVTASAAGSAGNQIKIIPTGLPLARSTAVTHWARGWYRYSRPGTNELRGPLRWDGVDLLPVGLGISPSFAVASGNVLAIFLKFPIA